MEALHDFTWIDHLKHASSVERFYVQDFKAVALIIPRTEERHLNQYRYRMLFFPKDSQFPVLAINFEHTILESFCLTMQTPAEHTILSHLEESLPYDEFKSFAVKTAEDYVKSLRGAKRKAGSRILI